MKLVSCETTYLSDISSIRLGVSPLEVAVGSGNGFINKKTKKSRNFIYIFYNFITLILEKDMIKDYKI